MFSDRAFFLFVEALLLGRPGNARADSRTRRSKSAAEQLCESKQCIFAVQFLASRALGHDLKDSIFADARRQLSQHFSLLFLGEYG